VSINLVTSRSDDGERLILATFIASNTTINSFFLRQTLLMENYSLLRSYEVVNCSIDFIIKRTGNENLPPPSFGHGQNGKRLSLLDQAPTMKPSHLYGK